MTEEEAKTLKVGDRVIWKAKPGDEDVTMAGTVRKSAFSHLVPPRLTIEFDDGQQAVDMTPGVPKSFWERLVKC